MGIGGALAVGHHEIGDQREAARTALGDELQSVREHLDDYLSDAMQLTRATASVANVVRNDRPLIVRLLHGLALSHVNGAVYGIGAFYAPDVFDRRSHRFDPFWALLPNVRYSVDDDRSYDYPKLQWYKNAVAAKGRAIVDGPFYDSGQEFVSVDQAFYDRGKLAGVAVEVVEVEDLYRVLRMGLRGADVAYVAGVNGRTMLSTDKGRDIAGWMNASVPVPFTRARLHVAASPEPLRAADMRIVLLAAVEIGAILLATLLAAALLLWLWRARIAHDGLVERQAAMEREISVAKVVEAELRKAAYADALTGLPNRLAFLERGAQAIAASRAGHPNAVFFIDLDRFNVVNDTLGHVAGDELLKLIARRLRDGLPGAHVSRLGGDEYVVLAGVEPAALQAYGERILALLREPMLLGGRTVYTAASIGIVVIDATYAQPEELLRDADIAMYAAKRDGRGRCAFFDSAMRRRIAAESELETDLRHAVERHEFVAFYQPVVAIASRAVVSFEALARWQRPGHGLIGATDFIGYAESHGLVDGIDREILARVCKEARALFDRFPGTTVAVNVSAAHLCAPELADEVAAALRNAALPSDRIRLEVTETAVMADAERAHATLDRLRDRGLQIVLDDFGAGHSSLAYLHHLPIAGVKIDRSFVKPLPSDVAAIAIVRSIVALARTLGLYTVAEGVETAEQVEELRKLGVLYAQGFFFSPPLDLEATLGYAEPTAS